MQQETTKPRSAGYDQPCRLCGGSRLELFYTQGDAHQFRFYRCRDCLLVNYDLSAGLNQAKYAEVFHDPLDERLPRNRRKTMIFQALLRHASPPARLLEIGCGNGRLLHLAREAGFEVSGVELSPFLAESVRARLGIPVEAVDFFSWSVPPECRFDAVVLQHVLEHLPDPIKAMGKIHDSLRPGGVGVLEFPYIDGWDLGLKRVLRRWGIYSHKYPSSYRPGHCNEYCRQSFDLLCRKTGFRLESWRTYSWKPLTDAIYSVLPIGNKARAIVRKISDS